MIETIFDYKFYLDKISEFMLDTFEKEQTTDFQHKATINMLNSEIQRLQTQNQEQKEALKFYKQQVTSPKE